MSKKNHSLQKFIDSWRVPQSKNSTPNQTLPLPARFWLYFFITTTLILAFTTVYFVVKLEKMTPAPPTHPAPGAISNQL